MELMVSCLRQIRWLCVIITPGGEHVVPLPLAWASISLDFDSANLKNKKNVIFLFKPLLYTYYVICRVFMDDWLIMIMKCDEGKNANVKRSSCEKFSVTK